MAAVRKAREYLRVSKDRSGRQRSIDEQHGDNQRAADEHGWSLGKPYIDSSVSASRYARTTRDDFARMLDDLDRDRFGAKVLVLWESSRGSRRTGEWVDLIELCEKAGVSIFVTTHGREYQPGNARDRRSMLEDAVDSEYESGKVSMRSKRAAAANAAAGRPHGPIAYGYTRAYDPKTRRLLSQDPEPAEAAVIRELYDRLGRGHTLRAVAADFVQRGVRTRTGKVFTGTHLRDMALSPLYAGMRGTGGHGKYRSLDGVTLIDAQWPPLVTKAQWYAVRARLTAPERTTTIPGAARHPLTFIAVCHVCSGPMGPTRRDGTPQLQCHRKGHVKIDETDLNGYAERVLLAYLARPDVIEQLRAGERDDGDLAGVRDSLAEARAELAHYGPRSGSEGCRWRRWWPPSPLCWPASTSWNGRNGNFPRRRSWPRSSHPAETSAAAGQAAPVSTRRVSPSCYSYPVCSASYGSPDHRSTRTGSGRAARRVAPRRRRSPWLAPRGGRPPA